MGWWVHPVQEMFHIGLLRTGGVTILAEKELNYLVKELYIDHTWIVVWHYDLIGFVGRAFNENA